MELTRRGFAIENEWYWRITENAQTFDVTAAIRDFLAPLARLAKDTLALTEIAADLDEVRFHVDGTPATIKIGGGLRDRVAIGQFVSDLNRALAPTGHAFALVVPRRYELRGVLLADRELASLYGTSMLMIPSGRASSGSIIVPA
jgi:hypothetical protein